MAVIRAPYFGIAVYLYFVWVWASFIVFAGNYQSLLPFRLRPWFYAHSLDLGERGAWSRSNALLIDTALIILFCVQHSGMARKSFKHFVTSRLYDRDFERSVYVFASSFSLHLLMKCWIPIDPVLFRLPKGLAFPIGIAGWAMSVLSTFMIDHFEMFGLKQAFGFHDEHPQVCTHVFNSLMRHPMFTGFLIGVWSAVRMTVGHLLFAGLTTLFIVTAVYVFEEPQLEREFGLRYSTYKQHTPAFCPFMPTPAPVDTKLDFSLRQSRDPDSTALSRRSMQASKRSQAGG